MDKECNLIKESANRQGPLAGQVAAVTGAGRGIGKAIAETLAGAGAALLLAGRDDERLSRFARRLTDAGASVWHRALDVSAESAVCAWVRDGVAHFGKLDILVNNAGIGAFGPLSDLSTAQWDRVMAVNVRGPFLFCRECLPYLRSRPLSFIVNIASVVAVKGYPNQSVYGASKHALLGMSKALAKEVQQDGVRVHVLCPGGVDTDLAAAARPDLDRSELMSPQEIADAVYYLVTRRGKAVIDEIHLRRQSSLPWA